MINVIKFSNTTLSGIALLLNTHKAFSLILPQKCSSITS